MTRRPGPYAVSDSDYESSSPIELKQPAPLKRPRRARTAPAIASGGGHAGADFLGVDVPESPVAAAPTSSLPGVEQAGQ